MANNALTARDNYAAYSYARDNGHLDFIDKARKCDNYFRGSQWDTAIRNRLERLGKPVITINKVLSTVAAVWGEQLSHRADISFRPGRKGQPETAEVLDRLWMHLVNTNNYDWLESQMAAEAFIRSRGFVDLRVSFDDQLRGEARISLLNSKNVLIDPDASHYDPDEWAQVFVTKWLTGDDIERVWGEAAAKEVSARGYATNAYRYDTADWMPDTFGGDTASAAASYEATMEGNRRLIHRIIERQYRETRYADHFVNVQTGDMREIPSSWDRERIANVMQQYSLGLFRKKVKKIRWTVSTDDVTLFDEISPLKHFTPIPFFPFFMHGTTIGIVENMLSPQDLLNKSVSQELHVINTTANSGWKVKDGTLVNMTPEELEDRGAEDGLVVITSGDPNANLVKITPNQIPTGLDRVSYKADEYVKDVSMISDSMRGFDRADVAAKAIRAKQARGTVSLAAPFNNLDYTRRLLARNTLDILQSFYTEERVIQMVGRDLSDEPEEIVINQMTPEGEVINDLTVGEYAVIVSTVPARESFEDSQFQEALALRKDAGVAIPDDVLIEHSHLNRKGEIAKRIRRLSGGEDPTQQELEFRQQVQELELRAKQADVAEKEASAQLKQANAALNAAKAQVELLQARGAESEAAAEQLRIAQEREAAMEKLQTERMVAFGRLQLEREKARNELELAREKARNELELTRDMHSQKMDLMKQESAAKQKAMAAAKPKPTTGAEK